MTTVFEPSLLATQQLCKLTNGIFLLFHFYFFFGIKIEQLASRTEDAEKSGRILCFLLWTFL